MLINVLIQIKVHKVVYNINYSIYLLNNNETNEK